jgi:hypothetical protein
VCTKYHAQTTSIKKGFRLSYLTLIKSLLQLQKLFIDENETKQNEKVQIVMLAYQYFANKF